VSGGSGATNLKNPEEIPVPTALVILILSVPACSGLVLALIVCVLMTVKLAAVSVVVGPNLTTVAPMKFVPVIVTVVPPRVEPLVGVKLTMIGMPAVTNVKLAVEVAVPPEVVTLIFTVPAACALVLATTLLVPVTEKLVAGVVPNVTEVAPFRLVPVMATVVPPLVDPLVGVNEVMVGAGATNL
jgi:hypothetical protein